MWHLTVPWYELIARGLIIYSLLLVLLRLTGKRQIGQLSPFDLLLLLIISNAVQNAMNGGDNSVTAGAILAGTLIGLNYAVGYLSYRSPKLGAIIEGRPVVLLRDGQVIQKEMNDAQLTEGELMAALHEAGLEGPGEARLVILENTGRISVVPKDR